MNLTGKTALVTGSTSGIGLGIALALARQGATASATLTAPRPAWRRWACLCTTTAPT
jgi:NAD(P)-dependent dehydrogenase (short-subunit alcohol dehydrogenase family)